jgi:small RNA 2'-O-methyltransferase
VCRRLTHGCMNFDHACEHEPDGCTSLHDERLVAVQRALVASGAQTVLDLGCGGGELLVRLAREPQLRRIVGMDISAESLFVAEALLDDALGEERGRVSLLEASFTTPDRRLEGFDAAALVETIEHVETDRLSAVERAVFGSYRPATVIVTTPNCEYNELYGLAPGILRHPDHRFEWTRARFRAWASGVSRRNGYAVSFTGIGEPDVVLGSSTQMATFTRSDQSGGGPR